MKIRNWNKFQHYSDRCPPWIKIYKELLDDINWHRLSGDASKLLVNCWLLASEDCQMEGHLPTVEEISFRLRMDQKKVDKLLLEISGWLDSFASDTLAESKQDARLETETETETETELTRKEPVISIPLNVNGHNFNIYDHDIKHWEETFPAVDVMQELRMCRDWNINNPHRRKTKRGIRNHISYWLGRSQNRGGNSNGNGRKQTWEEFVQEQQRQGAGELDDDRREDERLGGSL